MAKSYISMTFITDSGKQSSLNIQNPKDNLTDAEIQTVMDIITTSNSFIGSNGTFAKTESAKLVTTQEEPYSL